MKKGFMKENKNKIKNFFKKYGVDAILALFIFNFPMYAVLFIRDPNFINFAAWWTAIWWGLGPLTPGWLFTVLLAVFIRWLRIGIFQGILFGKEVVRKLQLQNQLAAYLTSEEINIILEMAKKVDIQSEEKRKQFREHLRKQRLQMLDDQWTKEAKNIGDDKNSY